MQARAAQRHGMETMSWPSSNKVSTPGAPGAPVKTLLALLLVAVLAIFATYRVTDGFRVVPTEDGRRLAIKEQPRRLPEAVIQYEDGTVLPLAQALREDGRKTLAVIFYTRCNAVCSVIGTEFQQLQENIRERGLNSQQRGKLRDALGITVIPAPLGEFQLNAAFHVLSPDGRLVRIVDYDQPV